MTMGSRLVRRFASFSVVSLWLVTTSLVHAAPTASAAERETARRLMDEGKARMKEKDPARAVESFQKAHEIMHVPTTGLALARAHLAAGHLVEARDVALEVARIPREGGEPSVFEGARKQARELDAQLKSRIPTLRIKIRGSGVSKIQIDNNEISPAIIGEPVAVNPGKHVVSAKNVSGGEATGEVELAEREAKEVELVLPAQAEPTPKPPASAPSGPTSSPPPAPKVQGFGNDDSDRGGRSALAQGMFFGGLGAIALGGIAGSITGVMTLSKASDLEPQCQNNICGPEATDNLDTAHTLGTISTIGFIVAGAGAVVFGASFLMPRERSHRASKGISFAIGSGLVGGTF